MSEILKINNWINNQEVPAEKYLDVIDPGNNDVIVAQVAQGTEETIQQAAEAAQAAQPAARGTADL